MNDLATALTALVASAVAVPATAELSTADAFAALLAGTVPQPAPAYPVRCPVTGGVWTFAHTAAEAETIAARLAA